MQKIPAKFLFGLKVIIAALSSILLAQALGLEFALSAGIVAILSVQATKKETIKTAASRFFAFIIAIGISFISFKIFGFTIPAFFFYLALFIPVCLFLDWNSAMAMDSVLVSHFISFGAMGLMELKNECLLFLIGVGIGILVNIFLKKNTSVIERLKQETDDLIKQTLHRMGQRILNNNSEDFDGSCFSKLENSIFEAKKQAELNYKNQFGKKDTYDIEYLEMREKQIVVLGEMYKTLTHIKSVPFTAKEISDFFEKVSLEYHKDNDVSQMLLELTKIRETMKNKSLPQNRNEFEDRANLFVLLRQMNEFLEIKSNFISSLT